MAEGGNSNAVEVKGDPSGLYTLCDECLAERCAVSLDDSGEAPRCASAAFISRSMARSFTARFSHCCAAAAC